MKFAHLADCHIGGWRDPKLKDIPTKAFVQAIDKSIQADVDFILISGDLFNTSIPALDQLKTATRKLKEVKDKGIPVYIIPGSHDFSPSGKTILDVLESSGLFINVVKGSIQDNKLRLNFSVDEETGAKITGMLGRRGMLEKTYYESLLKEELEKEPGFKIFMFHTAITELKPKELEKMDSSPISLLPKNFDYYAGGHVHITGNTSLEGYKNIVYPGPLFPNTFAEIEKLGNGGFYLYEDGNVKYEPTIIHPSVLIKIDCCHKTPSKIEEDIKKEIRNKDLKNKILLVRLFGRLESGKVSDISFKEIFELAYDKSAYFVMKNTSLVKTKEFEEIKIDTSNIECLESGLIKEHLNQIKVTGMGIDKEEHLTKQLISIFNKEKNEGEKVADFESRIKEEAIRLLNI